MNWQTYTALAIVGITLTIFIYRIFSRKKSKASCGQNCGCGTVKKP
ncbi:MAG: FeoB-associated Cys-rich membrane protein [Akkermansiaceae bacterium]|jgi:hypothetical protein|nr:FeoB-associated Cys-rich membrane protein [Luteolibacter sp.]